MDIDVFDLILLTVMFISIVFILTLAIIFIIGLIEIYLQEFYGEEVIIYEECKNDYGQREVGTECYREIKCLDKGLFYKTCEELRN